MQLLPPLLASSHSVTQGTSLKQEQRGAKVKAGSQKLLEFRLVVNRHSKEVSLIFRVGFADEGADFLQCQCNGLRRS